MCLKLAVVSGCGTQLERLVLGLQLMGSTPPPAALLRRPRHYRSPVSSSCCALSSPLLDFCWSMLSDPLPYHLTSTTRYLEMGAAGQWECVSQAVRLHYQCCLVTKTPKPVCQTGNFFPVSKSLKVSSGKEKVSMSSDQERSSVLKTLAPSPRWNPALPKVLKTRTRWWNPAEQLRSEKKDVAWRQTW